MRGLASPEDETSSLSLSASPITSGGNSASPRGADLSPRAHRETTCAADAMIDLSPISTASGSHGEAEVLASAVWSYTGDSNPLNRVMKQSRYIESAIEMAVEPKVHSAVVRVVQQTRPAQSTSLKTSVAVPQVTEALNTPRLHSSRPAVSSASPSLVTARASTGTAPTQGPKYTPSYVSPSVYSVNPLKVNSLTAYQPQALRGRSEVTPVESHSRRSQPERAPSAERMNTERLVTPRTAAEGQFTTPQQQQPQQYHYHNYQYQSQQTASWQSLELPRQGETVRRSATAAMVRAKSRTAEGQSASPGTSSKSESRSETRVRKPFGVTTPRESQFTFHPQTNNTGYRRVEDENVFRRLYGPATPRATSSRQPTTQNKKIETPRTKMPLSARTPVTVQDEVPTIPQTARGVGGASIRKSTSFNTNTFSWTAKLDAPVSARKTAHTNAVHSSTPRKTSRDATPPKQQYTPSSGKRLSQPQPVVRVQNNIAIPKLNLQFNPQFNMFPDAPLSMTRQPAERPVTESPEREIDDDTSSCSSSTALSNNNSMVKTSEQSMHVPVLHLQPKTEIVRVPPVILCAKRQESPTSQSRESPPTNATTVRSTDLDDDDEPLTPRTSRSSSVPSAFTRVSNRFDQLIPRALPAQQLVPESIVGNVVPIEVVTCPKEATSASVRSKSTPTQSLKECPKIITNSRPARKSDGHVDPIRDDTWMFSPSEPFANKRHTKPVVEDISFDHGTRHHPVHHVEIDNDVEEELKIMKSGRPQQNTVAGYTGYQSAARFVVSTSTTPRNSNSSGNSGSGGSLGHSSSSSNYVRAPEDPKFAEMKKGVPTKSAEDIVRTITECKKGKIEVKPTSSLTSRHVSKPDSITHRSTSKPYQSKLGQPSSYVHYKSDRGYTYDLQRQPPSSQSSISISHGVSSSVNYRVSSHVHSGDAHVRLLS